MKGGMFLKNTMYTKIKMSLLKIMPSFRHQYEYYRNICKYMICREK